VLADWKYSKKSPTQEGMGRRSAGLLQATLCLLMASTLLASSQAPSTSSEWRQFRGNPRLTGVAPSVPPDTLKVIWSYQAGEAILSSPAVAEGVVYVGVGNGDLIAVDLASGKLRWKYSTKSFVDESSPAVGSGAVYVGDLDGTVHAVNTRDGKPLWTFKTMGEIKSSPVVVNDRVLIGSYDGHLYALDVRTGGLVWKYQTEGMVHATPAIVGDLAFIAGCDEVFRAIRIADGKQVYEIKIGAYTGASAVIDGDRAYFGTFNYDVVALNLKDRTVLWRFDDPERDFPFYSSSALLSDRIIFGGRDKFVRALNRTTGKEIWNFATRGRVDSSPAVAGGRVYIGSSDGRFYVLDAATGAKKSEFDAGSGIVSSPAIAAGRVLFGSQDGVLYCLG
jgi:eukaryotic-like serine/threonine-protein kinase